MVFSAEIQERIQARPRLQRICRQYLPEKDLVISSRIDFDGFAFEVGQTIAQQRLSFRTCKIKAFRTFAAFFREYARNVFLLFGQDTDPKPGRVLEMLETA